MFEFTAEDLRHRPTVSEHILWNYLRARRMLGMKFRRQHPIGPYIVDFVCLRKKFVIELDGAIHEGREWYDQRRDNWLESQGYRVFRINNDELSKDRFEVLKNIRHILKQELNPKTKGLTPPLAPPRSPLAI